MRRAEFVCVWCRLAKCHGAVCGAMRRQIMHANKCVKQIVVIILKKRLGLQREFGGFVTRYTSCGRKLIA